MDNIQYFFPDSENLEDMKKIVKDQGKIVCRLKISVSWINKSIHDASFGIAYISPKARMGRRSFKTVQDRYCMNGYTLCRIDNEYPDSIWIDIVCSRENNKTGELLIQLAEEHIKTKLKHVKIIQLLSLPEPKLKIWYKKLGYRVLEERMDAGKAKAFLMQKFLF